MVDLFEIDGRKKVKQLSKGMLVKLALLLAVSHRPELLVLDEPTTGLDPIVHEDFLDGVLRSVCRGGCTVLFSSHNLGDVRRLADSVCILQKGKVVVQRRLDELLSSTKRVRAVLTDGHLPRWVPDGTVWQRVQRREWLLTVDGLDAAVTDRLRSENPVECVEVFDLSLGDLFRDFILGEGVTREGTPMERLPAEPRRDAPGRRLDGGRLRGRPGRGSRVRLARVAGGGVLGRCDLLVRAPCTERGVVVAAMLGGNAIACERSDRSAHFLAYLPPTKTQILASKFLVAAGALAVLWGANCLVIYAIPPDQPRPHELPSHVRFTLDGARRVRGDLRGRLARFGLPREADVPRRHRPRVPLRDGLRAVHVRRGVRDFEVRGIRMGRHGGRPGRRRRLRGGYQGLLPLRRTVNEPQGVRPVTKLETISPCLGVAIPFPCRLSRTALDPHPTRHDRHQTLDGGKPLMKTVRFKPIVWILACLGIAGVPVVGVSRP